MGSSENYCPYCDCVRLKEPCNACLNSNFHCEGECICCAEYWTKNKLNLLPERKEESTSHIDGDNNRLEAKSENSSIETKEFHICGRPLCHPKPNNESQFLSPTIRLTESCAENGAVIESETEIHENSIESESSSDDYVDLISLEVEGKSVYINGKESAFEVEYLPFGFLRGSRVHQLASMAQAELYNPQEYMARKSMPRKPNQCDGCECLPGHVSCKECLYWDLTCTYPMGTIRCTCCDKFENLLDETED